MDKRGETWVEAEERAYPAGGFTRRAWVELKANPHNPIELPYGELRSVKASIPDTFFTVPAMLRYKGQTVKGFISADERAYYFTPDASPETCTGCEKGMGCK